MSKHGSPIALVLAAALVGCGGGGSDASSAPALAAVPSEGELLADPGAADAVAPALRDPSPDDARRVSLALERLGAHALVALARKLETGAPLSGAERVCLSAYDPALGEPLAALDCDEPLAIGDSPVALRAVRMRTDASCLATLGDTSRSAADVVAGCDRQSAELRLVTEWVPPPSTAAVDDFEGRPRPLTGASFRYTHDGGTPTLVATNLTTRLDGDFTCTADVASGTIAGPERCASDMADFADRLDALADALGQPAQS